MDFQISLATPEDMAEIVAIEKIIEGDQAADLAVIRERFVMYQEGFFVARCQDKVIGYAESCLWDENIPQFGPDKDFFSSRHHQQGRILYIIFVGVLPAFQRHGVGTALINALQDLAKERGKIVHAVTWEHLLPLYTKQGFKPVRQIPGFLADGVFTLLEYV